MAAIDKIYGTQKEYLEFRKWLKKNKPGALNYLYTINDYNDDDRPISNFPTSIDKWLLKNCDIDWVVDRIKEQYDLK